ncbi:MAG: hypothetical protein HQK53_20160, partial [Oligoflexia bacterium]|nr:hypothetical protein [Oligoflexia bacterium]
MDRDRMYVVTTAMTTICATIIAAVIIVGSSGVVGCGKRMEYLQKPADRDIQSGNAAVAALHAKDLYPSDEIPMVLIFFDVYCGSCNQEHQQIIADIKNFDRLSQKVQFYSVLVGEYSEEEIAHWKLSLYPQSASFPWPVISDEKGTLFAKLCKKNIFPCVTIFLPHMGLVFSANAKVPLPELKRYTGDWNEG